MQKNTDTRLKEMMTDPTKVNQRIFVGSIPTDNMTMVDLERLFQPFGPVEGALLNRGFGFVQFEKEESANEAVASNGRIAFRGRPVDVKPARPIKRNFNNQRNANNVEERDRSPINFGEDRGREPTRFPVQERRRFQAPPANPDRANDCEIIVVNKNQTEYAEHVEQKLRRLGLSVDLLFPNEDVPVARVLTNIANKGCLFAIVIMPQNEEHRSMTLNILHGPPQEHRNMPLEDAVALVSSSFEAYVLREKPAKPMAIPIVTPAPVGGLSLADRHPESIQVLLNLLADNRMLTVIQYDKIIAYLQGRRDLQIKVELGDAAPTSGLSSVGGLGEDKAQTLQARILGILNKQMPSAGNATPAATSHSPATTKTSPLLSDPSVQKALSNLMQGDILRKLSEPR